MQDIASHVDSTPTNPAATVTAARDASDMKKSASVSPYVLLFCILALAAMATWLVPPGDFERVVRNGATFVVPNSLHETARHGVGPAAALMAIVTGTVKSAQIIFLILFTGGAVAVLERTGSITVALSALSEKSSKSDVPIILLVCAVFAVLGTVGVVSNSVVAFIPLGLLLARSMRLPPIFGVALIYVGAYSGFNVAILSPQTTGLTQRMAELPLFSGMGLRAIANLAFVIAAMVFLVLAARRFRRESSDTVPTAVNEAQAGHKISPRQCVALAISATALATFMYGALKLHWGEDEMAATFIVIGILSGLICKLNPSTIANQFLEGCGKIVPGALIVGLAKAISIVLSDGHILDPIVDTLAHWLAPLHAAAAAIGMFVIAAVMHVAISSGSGESAVLVPIFAPLGDALHLTRQVTVQAILFGEGLVNCINPTSGVLMAVLATAGVPFFKWVRFVLPLILVWTVICVVTLMVGVAINWGPF